MTHAIGRRRFLGALPVLAMAPRLAAQAAPTPFRTRGLSSLRLTVSDVARSQAFYQGLFGMPIQARQGATIFLRIGAGPQFLALTPAAAGERPSISAFSVGVEDFSVERVTRVLTARGLVRLPSPASEVFVTDPGGIRLQVHDVTYCGGGPSGTDCATLEPSPAKGLMALRDMSHFTIFGGDPQRSVAFYQDLFGAAIQAYQGAAPVYGVGPGVHFLMFAGGPGRGGAPPAAGRIDHACMSMTGFDPAVVTRTLVGYGLKEQPNASREPLMTYISLRMPNRGGAEGGTPELYLTDPDGLAIQLQDVTYCGGAGLLGDVCPPL